MSANVISAELRFEKRAQEAEAAVVGGLLLDPSAIVHVDLLPAEFISSTMREIYSAIRRLSAASQVADVVTVSHRLSLDTGRDDWRSVCAELWRNTSTAANIATYANIVRSMSRSRQLREIGQRLVSHDTSENQELIDHTIRELMLLNSTAVDWVCDQAGAIQAAIDYIDKASNGNVGVSWGMADMDAKLGRMHPGDLIVIAARPAMGKTAFMLNVAAGCKEAVGIISGEQGRDQMGMRMLAINGQLSLHKMRKGALENDEWNRVTRVFQRLKEQPIWYFDKPGPTIDEVIRQARAWKYERNIKLLMVDYLQKIRGGIGQTRDQQIGDIASRLKDIARELAIPVIALAQVNREVEKNPLGSDGMGRMPYMGDIRESGAVEAEADSVITLYRPGVYLPDDDRFKGIAFANVCKSRHGPVGKIQMAWRGEFLQFGDLAHTERDL